MIGNVLKLVRIYNQIPANFVAKKLSILPKHIRKIEKGKTKISLSTLERFSELYHMPISQILILNDMQENFKVSDGTIWEDIQRYYVCEQDELQEEKTKSRGCMYANR